MAVVTSCENVLYNVSPRVRQVSYLSFLPEFGQNLQSWTMTLMASPDAPV